MLHSRSATAWCGPQLCFTTPFLKKKMCALTHLLDGVQSPLPESNPLPRGASLHPSQWFSVPRHNSQTLVFATLFMGTPFLCPCLDHHCPGGLLFISSGSVFLWKEGLPQFSRSLSVPPWAGVSLTPRTFSPAVCLPHLTFSSVGASPNAGSLWAFSEYL